MRSTENDAEAVLTARAASTFDELIDAAGARTDIGPSH